MYRNSSILLLLSCLLFLSACAGGDPRISVRSDDEERVFMLAAGPNSEGDFPGALSAADSLLASLNMSDSLRGYIMMERAVALANMGRVDDALRYSDTLSEFARHKNMRMVEINACMVRGSSMRRLGDNQGAVDSYTKGLDLAMAEGDKDMEQAFNDYLSVIYGELGRMDESRDFAWRSYRLAEEMGDSLGMLSALSTVGVTLQGQGKYAEAAATLRPFQTYAEQAIAPYQIKYLSPLMKTYLNLDSLDRVRELMVLFRRAAAQFPAPQYEIQLVSAESLLAEKEHRFADQWELMLRMDSIGYNGKTTETIAEERASCLANMGRYREAYDWLEKGYRSLKESRLSSLEHELSDLSVRYDTLSKQLRIEHLTRQRWIWGFVALGALLLLGVTIFAAMFSRHRSHRRHEREIHEQYIRGMEQERRRFALELHDDIAGELVGLQFGLESLPKAEVGKRISEIGQSVRRLSHELMPPDFERQTLCQLLLDYSIRFNSLHPGIHLTLTDEGSFDWTKLTPAQNHELYRIVQESVSNAVRHACPTEIRIALGGDSRFSLEIENNGATGPAEGSGIGHRTLVARARILGADLADVLKDNIYKITIQQK